MWKKVELNCRNFKCENNKEGNCQLETVALQPTGALMDHLTCNEASPKPKSKVVAETEPAQ